jgi:acetyl-CoA C-acetyltransferase
MTETPSTEMTTALATAADADWESDQGLSFVALNALVMQRYMYEYHWKPEHFAPFSINAHQNAVNNPYARLQFKISQQDYEKARMVAAPINLMDASPVGDGAAALYLIPADELERHVPQVRIMGSASATDTISIHSRKDPTWLTAAELSAKAAYAQAGIQPADVDLFEYHDAFSIMAVLSLEAAGFASRGKGPVMALDGEINLSGRLPVATFGGLKARGHPVGATGVYQVVELVRQLRCEADLNQVDKARIGMAQNIGGSGATVITHILQRWN